MTTEEQEDIPAAVSEQPEIESQETQQEEQKMVPLAALQAERRKRQELETRARVYEEMMAKNPTVQQEKEEEEDPEALLTKGSYSEDKQLTKREILEQIYQDMNPEAVRKIGMYLKPILDKKPWLASTIDNSVNRLARANEIIDDYMHLIEEKPKNRVADAKRIVENAQKPRSPVEVGKTAQQSNYDLLKGMQGKKEFREYRQKILRGEA